MPLLGERAAPDVRGVGRECPADLAAQVGVLLHEARRPALVEPEQVVPDEDLAVAAGAGADPDGRDLELCRHPLGDRGRDGFEHEREAARRLERERVLEQPLRRLRRAPLRLEPAEHRRRLRRQA